MEDELRIENGECGGRGMRIAASACGLLAMTGVFCHSEERSDVGIRSFPSGVQFPTRWWRCCSFSDGPRGTGSAERSGERGKRSWSIRSLPDEGGVQHGAQCSEV